MSNNELLAQPVPLELATRIEGLLEIGGQYFLAGQADGWNSGNYAIGTPYQVGLDSITRNSTNGGNEAVIGVREIPRNQPWRTQFSLYDVSTDPASPFDVGIGVKDNLGRITVINPYRYPPETHERYHIYVNGQSVLAGSGFGNGAQSDVFAIESNGQGLSFFRFYNGQWHLIYPDTGTNVIPIPDDVLWYKFYYYLYYHGNKVYTLRTRIDDVIVPVTTANSTFTEGLPTELVGRPDPQLSIRIVDLTHYGLNASAIKDWNYLLRNQYALAELPVAIHARSLFIRPKDRQCGAYAIYGETIEFESNGGDGGEFTAIGGTILSNLKWQAPFVSGQIDFTYRIGAVNAYCLLNIVPKLTVEGVDEDGYYADLAQGEHVQFISTCPEAVFQCTNHSTLITPQGLLVAPTDAKNSIFGEKTCIIKVMGCGQIYTFKIHIQAMYPTERFCGPSSKHWLSPNRPDYLANTLIMTGGTSQVKNRNKQGVLTWEVSYEGLPYQVQVQSECPETDVCQRLQVAKRLDDFYKQVKYVTYFTVVDEHSQIVYKYVRLTKYDGNHNLYATEQTRNVTMRQEGDVLFESGVVLATE